MLAGFLALVLAIIRLFPETALAKSLHRWFVEIPLEFAQRIERKHIILIAILLCSGQTLALAGGAELAIAYAADMSLYLDAMLATYAAAAMARFRSAAGVLKSAVARAVRMVRPRPRERKPKRTAPRPPKPGNDDDPLWAWTAQAA